MSKLKNLQLLYKIKKGNLVMYHGSSEHMPAELKIIFIRFLRNGVCVQDAETFGHSWSIVAARFTITNDCKW